MILLIIIGIISTNKNFPAIYSFAKSEATILINSLFKNFKHFVFNNNIARPRVVLTDQAAGLIATMSISMLNCQL
jgi:hypothetical protein